MVLIFFGRSANIVSQSAVCCACTTIKYCSGLVLFDPHPSLTASYSRELVKLQTGNLGRKVPIDIQCYLSLRNSVLSTLLKLPPKW